MVDPFYWLVYPHIIILIDMMHPQLDIKVRHTSPAVGSSQHCVGGEKGAAAEGESLVDSKNHNINKTVNHI